MSPEHVSLNTMEDLVDYWLGMRENDLAPSTFARYRTLARNQVVPYVGSVLLQDLTPERLRALYADLALSGAADGSPLLSSTIGQVHRFIHVMLEWAAEQRLLAANPADRVKAPSIAPRAA